MASEGATHREPSPADAGIPTCERSHRTVGLSDRPSPAAFAERTRVLRPEYFPVSRSLPAQAGAVRLSLTIGASDDCQGEMDALASALAFSAVALELVGFGGLVFGAWGVTAAVTLWTAALALVAAGQFFEWATARARGRLDHA